MYPVKSADSKSTHTHIIHTHMHTQTQLTRWVVSVGWLCLCVSVCVCVWLCMTYNHGGEKCRINASSHQLFLFCFYGIKLQPSDCNLLPTNVVSEWQEDVDERGKKEKERKENERGEKEKETREKGKGGEREC